MWKEEGKGVSLFLKKKNSLLNGYGGGVKVFSYIYVEGGWEREGVDFFFTNSLWGGGGGFGWKYPFSK